MKTKKEIVENWLPRYTGVPNEDFGEYILLTNFMNYVNMFSEKFGVEIQGKTKRCRAQRPRTLLSSISEWAVLWLPP